MDFALDEELLAMKEAARDFTQKEIVPNADLWDEEHYFPIEVVHKMGELGYYGCIIPEEYGGSGKGYIDFCIAVEELARGSAAAAGYFRVSLSLAVPPVTTCWLSGVLEMMTEPEKAEPKSTSVTASMVNCS